MADSIFVRALNAAAQVHGSTQALAGDLRVPEGTLLRWMAGRAMMPVRAFIRLLEILTEHERKVPEEPGTDAAAGPILMFSVNKRAAHCRNCAGTEFVQQRPAPRLRYSAMLACRWCGHEVLHRALLVELAMLAAREQGDTRARRGARAPSQITSTP